MLISVVSLLLSGSVSLALKGKDLSDDVVGYLGIPYAKPPVKEMRFRESQTLPFIDAKTYSKWPVGCPALSTKEKSEDCLFLSLLKMKSITEKTNTLLIFSNEDLSEKKLTELVSSSLNVAVAAVRTGLLASLGNSSFGVSDALSAIQFLKENAETLDIGEITVWAESFEAETVASALSEAGVDRAILINGNAKTRTIGKEKIPARIAYTVAAELKCDLPSIAQAMDCLRAMPLSELYAAEAKITQDFKPFGNPFRSPSLAQPIIPTILGVFRQLPKDYPGDGDFNEKYSYVDFKRALAQLVPDSLYRNAPLLRRLVLHQYVYAKGDKKDTYFLFERMREALLDRDFFVPTQSLAEELRQNKNSVYLLEYGIDNPPTSCLQEGGWEEEIKPFCNRIFQYFTRFASKGQPTKSGCDPANPTFPALGSTKRDYHVILKADGKLEWDFNFHLAGVQLWSNLLPALDKLELQGRRDAVFKEDVELLPTETEDDVQDWHLEAAEQGGLHFMADDSTLHAEL